MNRQKAKLEKEDRAFIEKVIQENKEGLKRLAKEKDAERRRNSSIRMKLRDFYREITGIREKEGKKFMKIDMN